MTTLLATVALLSSCAGRLKPLDARYVKVDPQPLEVRGGKVPADITITFPAKWFAKNAQVRITPVLRYAGGEAWGSTTALQGINVRGNAQEVAYSNADRVTLHTEFDYKPEMKKSDLYLTFKAKVGRKEVRLPDVKVGEGVLATEAIASHHYVTPAIAPDAFQRIIKQAYDANILFLIQQAGLRPTELAKQEMKDWKGVVKSADITPNQKVDIEVQAYASPDGPIDLNERLATQREKNTTDYLRRELRRNDVDAPLAAHYTAEDWEGFRELVEKSDIQDKDLVLRVLSMYNDPVQREQEIRNISAVFNQLADEILPQLRRSRLIANVQIIGKSDDEILAMTKSNPRGLTVEELLYSATLVDSPAEKQKLYTLTSQLYPNDPRPWNNLGVLAYQRGEYNEAAKQFAKANQQASIHGETLQEGFLNTGLIAMSKGQVAEAEQLFGQAGDVPELNEALGYLYIKQGKYNDAARALREVPTNNGVLAQILNKDYNQAMTLLEQVKNPDAQTYYLKAIVGARTDNRAVVEEGLKQALAINPSLAYEIAKDREFLKYMNHSFFRSLVK